MSPCVPVYIPAIQQHWVAEVTDNRAVSGTQDRHRGAAKNPPHLRHGCVVINKRAAPSGKYNAAYLYTSYRVARGPVFPTATLAQRRMGMCSDMAPLLSQVIHNPSCVGGTYLGNDDITKAALRSKSCACYHTELDMSEPRRHNPVFFPTFDLSC